MRSCSIGIPTSEQDAQLSEHGGRRFGDVGPRVAAEVVSAGVGLALALPVALPRAARVVEAERVELHGQATVVPAAVDAAAARGAVRDREREALRAEQAEEVP